MKNHNEFVFPRKLDVLTGEYIDDLLGTDIQIASGEKSPSSAGNLTLASFTVEPGHIRNIVSCISCVIANFSVSGNTVTVFLAGAASGTAPSPLSIFTVTMRYHLMPVRLSQLP